MSEIFDQSRLPHQFDDLLHLTKEQEDGRKSPPLPPVLEIETDSDDSQVEQGWDLCMVCKLDSDHGAGNCPYRKYLPDGAKLGPGWKPACSICDAEEFDADASCLECGCEATRCAVPIICGCCGDWGHEFEDCPEKDTFDSTFFLYPGRRRRLGDDLEDRPPRPDKDD